MRRSVVIIGSGFAGLSAAAFMAKAGWSVTVVEKNEGPGGRARQLKSGGFTFDMGPSWYWMPEVFERYFMQFGKKVTDYYSLQRLDPSYRIYWERSTSDVPAQYSKIKELFNSIENGSGERLDLFLNEAQIKYDLGMGALVYKPGLSIKEFFDPRLIKGIIKLDVFRSISQHIAKYFRSSRLRQMLEFPVLFLGALPSNTPALYSLMNYADLVGGTWYPAKGMYAVVQAMYDLAKEIGVEFRFGENARELLIEQGVAVKLITDKNQYLPDVVISAADYAFTENNLLAAEYRTYSDNYWKKRVMAPSCLIYYVGLNKKLTGVLHHSLFFDRPFQTHAADIYKAPKWPAEPLFYLNAPSVTDESVAPAGCENLMILIPVASGLTGDTEELREAFLGKILKRLETHTGQSISDSIIFKKSYSVSDFKKDYNSFRGNAYGLANTLMQTALLKPSCRSKKVKNLFYAGQMTVPGPGVPPSIISGEVVSKLVTKLFN